MAGNKDRFQKRRAIKEDSYATSQPTRARPFKQAKLKTPISEKRKPEQDISNDSAKKSKIQPGEPLAKDIGAPTFVPQEFDIEKVEGLDCFIIVVGKRRFGMY